MPDADVLARLAPELRALRDPAARVARAFAHLLTQSPRRALRPASPLANGRIPLAVHLARRWLDGEVCTVPGCSRDLMTQHDHFNARRWQGVANAALDRRLCGPCNRARARGELDYRHHADGTVVFHDARHRALGGVAVGTAWAAPIRAWAERLAAATGSRGTGASACPLTRPQEN